MSIKFKTAILNCSSIIANIGTGFLLSYLFNKNISSNFAMFSCAISVVSTLIVFIIANRSNIKLDLPTLKNLTLKLKTDFLVLYKV